MTMQQGMLHNGPLNFPTIELGEGPPVLLLHGFPDGPGTYAEQLPALAAAGYRAIAPTMRGYAPSAQPADGDYHAVRMAEDVAAWAAALGGRVHLIGHDWGASVGFAAAALAPEAFASFTAIAVPSPARFGALVMSDPGQQARSDYIMAFQSPDADTMIAADDFAYLKKLWRRWSPGWAMRADVFDELDAIFAQPGVPTATLGWYRQAFDAVSSAGQATQALLMQPTPVPTLGICGEDDGCISADIFVQAMQPGDFTAALKVECIRGAGHFVHREKPDQVNKLVLDWLAAHPI